MPPRHLEPQACHSVHVASNAVRAAQSVRRSAAVHPSEGQALLTADPTGADLRVAERLDRVVEAMLGWWRSLRRFGAHGPWIGAWSIVGVGSTVLSPLLLASPVSLMMLAPRALFVALAAPHLDLVPFVVLGTLRLSVTDPSYFVVGRRLAGETSLRCPQRCSTVPRWRQLTLGAADRLARWICTSRWLAFAVLFVRPSGRYLAVAGSHGVSAVLAGTAAVTGTATYLYIVHEGVRWMF